MGCAFASPPAGVTIRIAFGSLFADGSSIHVEFDVMLFAFAVWTNARASARIDMTQATAAPRNTNRERHVGPRLIVVISFSGCSPFRCTRVHGGYVNRPLDRTISSSEAASSSLQGSNCGLPNRRRWVAVAVQQFNAQLREP